MQGQFSLPRPAFPESQEEILMEVIGEEPPFGSSESLRSRASSVRTCNGNPDIVENRPSEPDLRSSASQQTSSNRATHHDPLAAGPSVHRTFSTVTIGLGLATTTSFGNTCDKVTTRLYSQPPQDWCSGQLAWLSPESQQPHKPAQIGATTGFRVSDATFHLIPGQSEE